MAQDSVWCLCTDNFNSDLFKSVNMQKVLSMTKEMVELRHKWKLLENQIPNVLHQPFWTKKISIEEKVKFINTVSGLQNNLYGEILRVYPEVEKRQISIGPYDIVYEV